MAIGKNKSDVHKRKTNQMHRKSSMNDYVNQNYENRARTLIENTSIELDKKRVELHFKS